MLRDTCRILSLVSLVLFLVGCSGGGGGNGLAGSDTGGSGNFGASGPLPGIETTTIRLQSVLARAIPTSVTSIRLSGFDLSGQLRYGPTVKPKAAVIDFELVPLSVRRVQIEYLAGQRVVGIGRHDLVLMSGRPTLLVDPDFDEVETVLTSLSIEPASLDLARGTSGDLRAVGHYDDGTVLDLSSSVTWTSNSSAVELDESGSATAVEVGSAQITASFANLSADATVNVSRATLTSIQLEPPSVSLPVGARQAFVVRGLFSDSTTQDLTTQASLQIQDPSVALLSQSTILALSPGQSRVTARVDGKTADASLTVTPAALVNLEIAPTSLTLAKGTSSQLSARGTLTDGSRPDLTASVRWTSADPSTVDVSPEGLARGVKVGSAILTARLGDASADLTVQVGPAVATSISVDPIAATMPIGERLQLTVTGTFSDGSSRDVTADSTYLSSRPDIAEVNILETRGVVQANAQGQADVTISFGGPAATDSQVEATFSVSVVPALLKRIELSSPTPTLPLGLSLPVVATGFFSDGSARPLSDLAWTVSNENAIVDQFGNVTARATGQVVVTAGRGDLRGTLHLTITEAQLESLTVQPDLLSLPLGLPGSLYAVGVYSDGSSRDLTAEADWVSTDPTVAQVGQDDEAGRITTLKVGQTLVRASVSGKVATGTVRVDSAVLAAIELQTASESLPVGLSRRVQAYGKMTDGRVFELDDALWESSNLDLAVVDQDGNVTAKKTGEVVIQARRSGITGSITMTLSAAVLQGLTVNPADLSTFVGEASQLEAIGFFSDGTEQDLTSQVRWQSSNPDVATVDNLVEHGLLRALSPGGSTLTVSLGEIQREVTVEVKPLVLLRLELAPTPANLPKGASLDFQAYGFFNDSSKRDITREVTWTSSQPAIASITTLSSGPDDVIGRVVAKTLGETEITARMPGTDISATSPLTVTPAVIVSLAFDNPETVIPRGTAIYFKVMATYSDSSVSPVSTGLSYSSSDSGIGMVTPVGSSAGAFRAFNSGSVTVSAFHNASGLSASRTLTITDTKLWKLSFLPETLRAPLGYTVPYRLYATYYDGRRVDITGAPVSFAWNTSSYPTYSALEEFDTANGLFTPVHPRSDRPGVRIFSGDVSLVVPTIVHGDASESLAVSSTISDVPVGRLLALKASAIFTEPRRTTFDVTRNVIWSSSNPSIATVSNALNSEGVVTGVSAGQAVITAEDRGRTATFTVEVTSAQLSSLRIKEGPTAVEKGYDRQFYVEGLFDDGSRRDLGGQASWSVSDSDLATISNSMNSRGLFVGNQPGLVTVTMQDAVSGLTDTKRVSILESPIRRISPLKGKLVEMRLSPSGDLMYCLESDALRRYHLPDWTLVSEIPFNDGLAMDLSPDGAKVVVTRLARIASIVDTNTFAVTSLTLPGEVTERLSDVDIGTDGLAYVSSVKHLHLLDLALGTAQSQLYPYPGSAGGVIAKVDGTDLLLTVRPGVSPPTLTRHRLVNGVLVLEESLRYGGSGQSLTVSPDGDSFLFVRPETTGSRTHFLTRDFLSTFPAMIFDTVDVVGDYCFSRSGSYVFAAPSSGEDRMLVFEGKTGRLIQSLPTDSRRGYLEAAELELSPDGRFLYTAMTESLASYTEVLTVQVEE